MCSFVLHKLNPSNRRTSQAFPLKELCSAVAILLLVPVILNGSLIMQQCSSNSRKTLLACLMIEWTLPHLSVLLVSLVVNFRTQYAQYRAKKKQVERAI